MSSSSSRENRLLVLFDRSSPSSSWKDRNAPELLYGRSVSGLRPLLRSRVSDLPPPGRIDCPPPGPIDCPPPGPMERPPPGPIDSPPPGPMDRPPPGPIESQPPGPIELGIQFRHACAVEAVEDAAKTRTLAAAIQIMALIPPPLQIRFSTCSAYHAPQAASLCAAKQNHFGANAVRLLHEQA